MQDRVRTSWRRGTDALGSHAALGDSLGDRLGVGEGLGAQARRLRERDGQQRLAAWEGEGGASAGASEPMRVLIVDNDMKHADSLERMLHASGYSDTRVAYSGHAALAIAADFQPGVVLLELNLLDMSGYDLAQRLRERAQSQDLRLIALTSSREHAGRELARAAGVERYLLKPVTSPDLAKLLSMPSR
jgi:CheY-like chemotaxis protein